jgi:hypothetical protein
VFRVPLAVYSGHAGAEPSPVARDVGAGMMSSCSKRWDKRSAGAKMTVCRPGIQHDEEPRVALSATE